MNIQTQAHLLRLKGFLNEINHISYTYSQLGKSIPMSMVDEKKAKELITVYEDLLLSVKKLILNYENAHNTD